VVSSNGAEIVPTGDVDVAALVLAERIGGTASVRLAGFGNREFDAVSSQYVAQTTSAASASLRPSNYLSPGRRRQIRETLRAALETRRTALFEFVGVAPAPAVVEFITRNADRIGARAHIEVRMNDDGE
jgi:hypothetical protein